MEVYDLLDLFGIIHVIKIGRESDWNDL